MLNFIKAKLIGILVTAGLICSVLYVLVNNPFGWNINIFGGKLKIDKTENVVEQVKKISEFTTACYYQELVIKESKKEATSLNSLLQTFNIGTDSCLCEITLIAKGKVRAGFDLSKIKENDMVLKSDTLELTVPQAEIFDVIINPSSYEVYAEEGDWKHEEISKIQSKTAERLQANALKEGLLEKANKTGIEKLQTLFKSFGVKEVVINIQGSN